MQVHTVCIWRYHVVVSCGCKYTCKNNVCMWLYYWDFLSLSLSLSLSLTHTHTHTHKNTQKHITEDFSTNKYIPRIHTYMHAYLLTYFMPFNRTTGSMLPAAPRVRTPIPATLSHGQHLQLSSRLICASWTVRLLWRMKAGIKRKHACSRKLKRK